MKELKAIKILKAFLNGYAHENDETIEAIAELEALENRSCMNCKHNEITICKKLPSIDWSFEPSNDFYCSKWKRL